MNFYHKKLAGLFFWLPFVLYWFLRNEMGTKEKYWMTSQRAVNENDTFRKDNLWSKIYIYQATEMSTKMTQTQNTIWQMVCFLNNNAKLKRNDETEWCHNVNKLICQMAPNWGDLSLQFGRLFSSVGWDQRSGFKLLQRM